MTPEVDLYLTPEEVAIRVGEVEELLADPEAAHLAEDNLRRDVLMAIAAGAPDPIGLAREALKSSDVEFERWYA